MLGHKIYSALLCIDFPILMYLYYTQVGKKATLMQTLITKHSGSWLDNRITKPTMLFSQQQVT